MNRAASSHLDTGYFSPAATLRGRYFFGWSEWSHRVAERADAVPLRARHARLRRVGTSQRGIATRRKLKHLVASAVDQSFLEEIAMLGGLERLEFRWPVTATDLSPLRNLDRLERLHIEGPRDVIDFTPLLDLPSLRFLFVEQAPHLRDAEWLADAHHLEAIGFEGSMWTDQKLASVAPFGGLRALRGLFLGAVTLDDPNLDPLADCPKLQVLQCARFAPREAFERLHQLKPGLSCSWFDASQWPKAALR